MKVKSLFEQYKQEFMQSSVTYCCYCCQPQEGKIGCCQENHFVEFRDLYPEDQQAIISEELELVFGADV
jgi:hypothetical protein